MAYLLLLYEWRTAESNSIGVWPLAFCPLLANRHSMWENPQTFFDPELRRFAHGRIPPAVRRLTFVSAAVTCTTPASQQAMTINARPYHPL